MRPGGDHREIEPDANSVTKHNRVASGFEIAPFLGTSPDRSDAGMEIAYFEQGVLLWLSL
jgi:hypothetical protein